MNSDVFKKFVNLLIDNARNNNINLMALYYTNVKIFDVIITLASIQFGMICYNCIIEVLKNEGKRFKKQLQ